MSNANAIVIVFDHIPHWSKSNEKQIANAKVILCPLTVCNDEIETVKAYLKQLSPASIEILSLTSQFHNNAFTVKNSYNAFIAGFGNKILKGNQNFKEYFKAPFSSFSLWWSSLISERNPLKSPTYNHTILLKTIIETLDQYTAQSLWVNVMAAPLAENLQNYFSKRDEQCVLLRKQKNIPDWLYLGSHFLNGFIRLASFIGKSLKAKRELRHFSKRKSRLKQSRFVPISYFPLIDEKALDQGKFVNTFYGPLQKGMEDETKNSVSWIAMPVDRDDFNFDESLKLAQRVNETGVDLFYLHEFLTLKSVCLALYSYFVISVKFLLIKPLIKTEFCYPNDNSPLWSIFKKEWCSSFCGAKLVEGLIYYYIFRELGISVNQQAKIIYLLEMQAWEKALNVAIKERGAPVTLGIQHANLSPLHLSHTFHSSEWKGKNAISTLPRPHQLGCIGNIVLNLMRKSGWSDKDSFVLGGLRFEYLRVFENRPISWEKKCNKIVVTLPIAVNESKEILDYVYEAYKDFKDITVCIKLHPFCLSKELFDQFDKTKLPASFHIVDETLESLLEDAKIQIVTESSSSLIGLALGCRIITPRLSSVIDLSLLWDVPDLSIYVNSTEQLRDETENVLNWAPQQLYFDRSREFLNEYFDFPDNSREYMQRIESAFNKEGALNASMV